MSGPFSIRDAAPGDAARIAAMVNRLSAATGGPGDRMTAAIARRDMIGAPRLTCLVAEVDGRAMAYALYNMVYETSYAAHGVYLSDLYVAEALRRQGAARALLAEIAARSTAEGARFLWWIQVEGNKDAAAFYDALGAIDEPVRSRAVFGPEFDALRRRRAG